MSTALYRRYRPDTFAEVIGQEHVVEPLTRALDRNRVNHAYLFSGPRGCGKTTSARILARCLNCAQGPTGTPCGTCDSCVDLATGGAGSLDVVEIDAASHNGVDDARDLRERAVYAPARDRFKIFILDEAHMVTTQGFNALLKLVEEPPPHVKFVFATTEPDKVIGTIRSRTHHYPFRLVPPEQLRGYLAELCERENVPVAKGVLPLVVRAGGGSVRDTLSVLDQLMAGAGDDGMSYERAIALLGYTHATLLDDVVEGFGAGDGAAVYRVVDRVIESGHDPRRFVEDLLERLRDLIVIHAAPDAAQAILPGVPADQLERMTLQARSLGAAELSRAADVLNAGLSEMTGATSPRLQLELICARVLLPGIESSSQAMQARIDRLERRFGAGGGAHPAAPAAARGQGAGSHPAVATAGAAAAEKAGNADAAPSGSDAATPSSPVSPPESDLVASSDEPDPTAGTDGGLRPGSAEPPDATAATDSGDPPPAPAPDEAPAPPPAPSETGGDLEAIRRSWPQILDALSKGSKLTWALVSQNATVLAFAEGTLTLGLSTEPLSNRFNGGQNPGRVAEAVHEELGIRARVVGVVGKGNPGENPGGGAGGPRGGPGDGSGGGSSRRGERRDAGLQAPPEERTVDPWQSAEPAHKGGPWYTPEEEWAREPEAGASPPGGEHPREATEPGAEGPAATSSDWLSSPPPAIPAPGDMGDPLAEEGPFREDAATGRDEDVTSDAGPAASAPPQEPAGVAGLAARAIDPGPPVDEENYIGAYADLDISFTSNPGDSSSTARSADSPRAARRPPAKRGGPRLEDTTVIYARQDPAEGAGGAAVTAPVPPETQGDPAPHGAEQYDEISEDDEDQSGSALVGRSVVENILGGVVIEEKNE